MENIQLKDLLFESSAIMALTGAGISTAAGIPDFRSPTGIYNTGAYDPEKTFDLDWFLRDPSHFFRFTKDFFRLYDTIKPTKGHYFLAELERLGKMTVLVTQNIDGLHHMAGSENVIEMHGSYRTGHCLNCGVEYDLAWMRRRMDETDGLFCECTGLVKPDIVFFGEPVIGYERAARYAKQCDLFLAMGSSLTVQPAGYLPYLSQGRVVVINQGETAFPTERAALFLNMPIDEAVSSCFKN